MVALDIVEQSPLFDRLAPAALADIAGRLVIESWPKGSQILGPSDTTRTFRVIARGRVKITRVNPGEGRELTLWLLEPGDGFDLASLLDQEQHAVCAWALDEVTTLSAPLSVFRGWLEQYPPLRLELHRQAARRLRDLTRLAGDLALHDTMTRLSNLLLHYFDPQGHGDQPGADNPIADLPQSELASMIGSVRIVVSRLLTELRREGVVSLDDGVLRVTNLRKLLEHAEAVVAHGDDGVREGDASGKPRRAGTKKQP